MCESSAVVYMQDSEVVQLAAITCLQVMMTLYLQCDETLCMYLISVLYVPHTLFLYYGFIRCLMILSLPNVCCEWWRYVWIG